MTDEQELILTDEGQTDSTEIDNLETATENLLRQLIVTQRLREQQQELVQALEDRTRAEGEKLQQVEDKENELLSGLKAIEEPVVAWKWWLWATIAIIIALAVGYSYADPNQSFLHRQWLAARNIEKILIAPEPTLWEKWGSYFYASLCGAGATSFALALFFGHNIRNFLGLLFC